MAARRVMTGRHKEREGGRKAPKMPGVVVVVVQETRALKVTDLEAVGRAETLRKPRKARHAARLLPPARRPDPIELRPCSLEPKKSTGWCYNHHNRLRIYGTKHD